MVWVNGFCSGFGDCFGLDLGDCMVWFGYEWLGLWGYDNWFGFVLEKWFSLVLGDLFGLGLGDWFGLGLSDWFEFLVWVLVIGLVWV